MSIFEVKNCIKKYNNIEVLKGVNFSVEKGEITSVIGSSGGGKSTLLHICTFLEKMDFGEIIFNNKMICENVDNKQRYLTDKELSIYRQKLGLVFQNFNLFPHYTVLENLIDAPIIVQKRNKNDVIEEAKLLLYSMSLYSKINAYPQSLSGGQQQRVAIARALMMKPEILFFDEPTSALDPELTLEVLSTIKELAKKKYTMVIVTHEMEFAKKVSDKIVFIDDGKILEEGTSEYIFTKTDNIRVKQFIRKYE